jgi:hypothetical protein
MTITTKAMETYARELVKDGVTVLPELTRLEVGHYQEAIIKYTKTAPEFTDEENLPFVMGGFGALG